MKTDPPRDNLHAAIAPEAHGWSRLSEGLQDAGDRAFCLVLIVAVAVAVVLGALWFWNIPSFR